MALMLKELKSGDVLIADGGFTCLKEGQEVTVQADDDGELFFPCVNGRHWFNGQIDDEGAVIGLTRKA